MHARRISEEQIEAALRNAWQVEDYPDDKPWPSKLILGVTDGIPVHVVVGIDPQGRELAVITVYDPRLEPERWNADFRARRSSE